MCVTGGQHHFITQKRGYNADTLYCNYVANMNNKVVLLGTTVCSSSLGTLSQKSY